MRKFIGITLLLFIVILFFQNLEKSKVNVLFWQFEFSIGFWILSAFLSGLLLGYLFGFFGNGKKEDSQNSPSEDEEYLKP